jgi:hypothetical protein
MSSPFGSRLREISNRPPGILDQLAAAIRELSAALLSLQLSQQPLRSNQMVVENAPGYGEKLADEGVAHEVAHTRAFLAPSHDVLRSQHRQLLRDDRLVDLQELLQLLNAALALEQPLEDFDSDWVRERPKELRLEALELTRQRIHIN